MRLLTLFLFFVLYTFVNVFAQPKPYWQQQADYHINVTLNPTNHTLNAFETITYTNSSPDTLTYLWIHLWPNAYKNDRTAFSEQLLQHGDLAFYFGKEADRGYVNKLSFKVDGKPASLLDHPTYIDIAQLQLPQALAPNSTVVITTPFYVKLPYNYSRGGHIGNSYQITQWYPKVAMYDATGWHPMPYLDQGEYYNNFGNYTVNITLPQSYKVAATGSLQTASEQQWIAKQIDLQKNTTTFVNPIVKKGSQANTSTQKLKKIPANASTQKKINNLTANPQTATLTEPTKTITYTQNQVTDFAWFADKDYIIQQDSITLPNGHTVLCQAYYLPQYAANWAASTAYIKKAIAQRSKLLGNYPYLTCTAVSLPKAINDGMEYPTITCLNGTNKEQVNSIITHEVGHNWAQGILATNERDNPWMDEGLNTYYDARFEVEEQDTTLKKTPLTKSKNNLLTNARNTKVYSWPEYVNLAQPINTSSQAFTSNNYSAMAYSKAADWFALLQTTYGSYKLDTLLKKYYETYKYMHPQPAQLDSILSVLPGYTTTYLPMRSNNTSMVITKGIKKYSMLPVLGYNMYDGLLAGGLVHNYKPFKSKLRYALVPMYAVKSKQVQGIAHLQYKLYPKQGNSTIKLGVQVAKFGQNNYRSDSINFNLNFTKIAPYIRVILPSTNNLKHRFIQFKTFAICEDNLLFKTVGSGTNIGFEATKAKNSYIVNQLQYSVQKNSALYPYNYTFQLEHINGILRSTLTALQYFNYNEKQGLQVRLFAGKINYLVPKTISNQFVYDRYNLNLLAPKGSEDYTYSTYFYARNAFDKAPSSQLLQRDGFFKFRTDLLANKPGRTDNWLLSTNLVSDVPTSINPLQALPFKVPIKLFADIGTYAEVWKKGVTDPRFVYNAGLQLSIAKGLVQVYLPLIYSKIFSNYSEQMYGKKRSFNNISFSLNVNTLNLRSVYKEALY